MQDDQNRIAPTFPMNHVMPDVLSLVMCVTVSLTMSDALRLWNSAHSPKHGTPAYGSACTSAANGSPEAVLLCGDALAFAF